VVLEGRPGSGGAGVALLGDGGGVVVVWWDWVGVRNLAHSVRDGFEVVNDVL
jgi:hypothetical protein